MLPGKTYHLEDIARLIWRRIWFLIVPFAALAAGAAVLARILPDTYRASALIAVVPQQVPENIVRPTVTTRLTDRLQALQNQVLSRPRLEKLILELNLYPDARTTGIMENIVERMRQRDIQVTPQGAVAFRVSYDGPDAISTKRVVDQIASDFITESLSDRSQQADRQTQFLEGQVEQARQRLAEREAAVAAFRRAHGHELPTQTDTNLQAMIAANTQAAASAQARTVAAERRLQLDRQLAQELEGGAPEGAATVAVAAATARGRGTPMGPEAQALDAARKQLDTARARWTDAHPDVQKYLALVRELEPRAQAELMASAKGARGTVGLSPAEVARNARIEQLKETIAEVDAQIARLDADEKQFRTQAAEYRARIEAAPTRENELTELMRGYDAIQRTYNDLNLQSEKVKLSADLERQEIGQQFRLLEPATIPERPFSPDRTLITLAGMALGLGLGIGLIALLEYRDGAFRMDSEVTRVLGLPVLAVLPVMRSEQERQREAAWRWTVGLGLGAAVAGCLAVLAYTLVR